MKKGKSVRGETLFLRVLPNSEGKTRIGVAVSKKLAKSVPKKNIWKRRLRHITKEALGNFHREFDIILIAGERASKKPFQELVREAETLLQKSDIIKKE